MYLQKETVVHHQRGSEHIEKGMGEVAIVRRSIRRGTYRKRQYVLPEKILQTVVGLQLW